MFRQKCQNAACERWIETRDPISAALRLPNSYDSERHIANRVDELIGLLGLEGFRSKFVRELSTGTRRVVDLACLLAHRPSVILLDEPSSGIAQREAEALAPLLLRIRDKLSETHDAINQIRDLKGQIEGWERRLATGANTGAARDAAKALKATLSGIEDALIQSRADSPLCYPLRLNAKLAALSSFVDSADAAPTRQAYEVFDDLAARIDSQLTRLRDVTATDLAAVNRLIRDSDVPPITPAAAQQSVTGA